MKAVIHQVRQGGVSPSVYLCPDSGRVLLFNEKLREVIPIQGMIRRYRSRVFSRNIVFFEISTGILWVYCITDTPSINRSIPGDGNPCSVHDVLTRRAVDIFEDVCAFFCSFWAAQNSDIGSFYIEVNGLDSDVLYDKVGSCEALYRLAGVEIDLVSKPTLAKDLGRIVCDRDTIARMRIPEGDLSWLYAMLWWVPRLLVTAHSVSPLNCDSMQEYMVAIADYVVSPFLDTKFMSSDAAQRVAHVGYDRFAIGIWFFLFKASQYCAFTRIDWDQIDEDELPSDFEELRTKLVTRYSPSITMAVWELFDIMCSVDYVLEVCDFGLSTGRFPKKAFRYGFRYQPKDCTYSVCFIESANTVLTGSAIDFKGDTAGV